LKPGVKKFLLWSGSILGILFVSYQCTIFWYVSAANRAHREHLNFLESAGESLLIEDHRPSLIPDDSENFAQEETISRLIDEARSSGDDWESPIREEDIPGYDKLLRPAQRPVRYTEEKNPIRSFPKSQSKEEVVKTILAYCESHDDILNALAKAARRPACNLRVAYEEGYSFSVSELDFFTKSCLVIYNQGIANQIAGNYGEAEKNLITLLKTGSHLRQEPTLIYQLVSSMYLKNGVDALRIGIRNQIWTESQLERFNRELADINLAERALKSLRMESAVFTLTMTNLIEEVKSGKDQPEYPFLKNFRKANPVLEAWQKDNIRKFSEILQSGCLSDSEGNPLYSEFSDNTEDTRAEELFESPFPVKLRYLVALTAMPAYNGLLLRLKRDQFHADCARIAIAVERYRLKYGNLPESLKDSSLAPFLHNKKLDDPYSEKTLNFERLSDSNYLIYSVGPNGIDESGKHHRDRDKGDWVWTMQLPDNFDRDSYFKKSDQ